MNVICIMQKNWWFVNFSTYVPVGVEHLPVDSGYLFNHIIIARPIQVSFPSHHQD
jgi:hypothetical protein